VLDWTSSPYVAAYFAVEDHWSSDAVVWVVHGPALQEEMNSKYPKFELHRIDTIDPLLDSEAPPHLSIMRRLRTTERMVAQQGYFTICRLPTIDHAQIIAESLNNGSGKLLLLRIVIPQALKPDFLFRLRAMNIASNALFPGIDGVGRSISELVRLHRIPSPMEPAQPMAPTLLGISGSEITFPVRMVEPSDLQSETAGIEGWVSGVGNGPTAEPEEGKLRQDADRDGGGAQDESPRRPE
jgi:hypothetical protein